MYKIHETTQAGGIIKSWIYNVEDSVVLGSDFIYYNTKSGQITTDLKRNPLSDYGFQAPQLIAEMEGSIDTEFFTLVADGLPKDGSHCFVKIQANGIEAIHLAEFHKNKGGFPDFTVEGFYYEIYGGYDLHDNVVAWSLL